MLAWNYLLLVTRVFLLKQGVWTRGTPAVPLNPTHSVTVISDHYNGEEVNTITKHRMGKVCESHCYLYLNQAQKNCSFEQEVGPDDLQNYFPNETIL